MSSKRILYLYRLTSHGLAPVVFSLLLALGEFTLAFCYLVLEVVAITFWLLCTD